VSFDNSRITFDSWKDYLGVISQQGRVQLDSDWNESQAEFLRRFQAGTLDILGSATAGAGGQIGAFSTVGKAIYPAALPNSFLIQASTSPTGENQLLIGTGRVYVDGILVENHGPESSAQWDPVLAELSNSYPGAPFVGTDYMHQRHFAPTTAPVNGTWLVYLDVWQRPLSYIQAPHLVDQAVGIDTTGRLQTVWQVKLFAATSAEAPTCSTPDSSITGWSAQIQSSAARLTTKPVSTAPSGPCCITSNTGYTGLENQFYRVQVHAGTAPGPPSFKWSRDNGSVATAVTAIGTQSNAANETVAVLTVESVGRDQILGFNVGDWIELTDDVQELNGEAGELHLVADVGTPPNTIVLSSPLQSPGSFPLDSGGNTLAHRHTRIQRWDQKGKVYDENQNLVVDLGAAGSNGTIPINVGGPAVVLENGVSVSFSLDLNMKGGGFLVGDYWNFAARAADSSLETLENAPPRGIHHHYARLAVVTFPASTASPATDCRTPWPPAATDCCGCSVTLTPQELLDTNATLLDVLNQFQNVGNVQICLAPGTYALPATLRLTSAHSGISLRACQPATVVLQAQSGSESAFQDGMVVLDSVGGFEFHGLTFSMPRVTLNSQTFGGLQVSTLDGDVQSLVNNLSVSIGLRPINCDRVTVSQCEFQVARRRVIPLDRTTTGGGLNTIARVPGQRAAAPSDSNASLSYFQVGILAGGACTEFDIRDNVFDGDDGFEGTEASPFAGFMLAPSVSMVPTPAPPPGGTTPDPPTGVTVNLRQSGTAVARAADTAKVTPTAAAKTSLAQNLQSSEILDRNLGSILGIYRDGTSMANQAANGGSVLPCTLTDSVFSGNTFTDFTFGVLIVCESSDIRFANHTVDDSAAGVWVVAPTMLTDLLYDTQSLAVMGLAVAMGYPLPQNLSAQSVTVAPAPASVRIFAGSSEFTDSEGNQWQPDATQTSVVQIAPPGSSWIWPPAGDSTDLAAVQKALSSQPDSGVYQHERAGVFTYTFTNLPSGFYTVTLKFAEIFYGVVGSALIKRAFDVSINGNSVLTEMNIAADVGVAAPEDLVFQNIAPNSSHQIVVSFSDGTAGTGIDATPKVNAVQVQPQWDGSVPALTTELYGVAVSLGGSYALVNFYSQLAQLGEQGFYPYASSPLELRFTDNTMNGGTAAALLVLGDDQPCNGRTSSILLTGNRLDATVPISLPSGVSAKANIRFYEYFFETVPYRYFYGVGDVAGITRCVLSGNMVLNEGLPATIGYEENDLVGRVAFSVNDALAGAVSLSSVELSPGIAIAGNLFQGELLCKPNSYGQNISQPWRSQWTVLNTIID